MLGKMIHDFLNTVLIYSEHQNEFLFGDCQSDGSLSNTQEHILMVLSKDRLTNSDLSELLGISQAAVTKAVKGMIADGYLLSKRDKKDARVLYYELTDLALKVAEEHRHHHQLTVDVYDSLLNDFSSDEQVVIEEFIDKLENILRVL